MGCNVVAPRSRFEFVRGDVIVARSQERLRKHHRETALGLVVGERR